MIKHSIIVTDINNLVVHSGPYINLSISIGDCSIAIKHIDISTLDYKRIKMAMDSLDIFTKYYETIIKEHNDTVSLEWKNKQ